MDKLGEKFLALLTARTVSRAELHIEEDYREVLKACAHFLERGEAPPRAYALFLAKALRRVSESNEPFKEKLVKRKRGENRRDLLDRKQRIVEEVGIAASKTKGPLVVQRRGAGDTEGAADKIGAKYAITGKHVAKVYRKAKRR